MSVLHARVLARSLYSSWKQVFRPCTLGIVGLAIVIVLSAFGHKLSHYDRHAASSLRIQVVKLWSEPRKALVTTTARLRATVSRLLGSYAFLLPIQRFPRVRSTAAWILPVFSRGVAYFDFLIPFRSPPLDGFCPA